RVATSAPWMARARVRAGSPDRGKSDRPPTGRGSSRSERTATRLPPQRAWASTGAYEAALNGLFDENRPGEGDHEGLARIPGLPPSSRTCSMPIQKPLVVALAASLVLVLASSDADAQRKRRAAQAAT